MFWRKPLPTAIEEEGERAILTRWTLPIPNVATGESRRKRKERIRALFHTTSKLLWDWFDEEQARGADCRSSFEVRDAAMQIYVRMLRRIFGTSLVSAALQ